MHRAVIEYDRTVHRVEAELLLLNIARARHYRPVHFTAVTSVAATFDFRVKAGVLGRVSRGAIPDDSLVDLNYGTEVAENPTVTIIPVSGEEFTKRILRPLDESHLNFLVRQGFDLSMVLRLLDRGIQIDSEEDSLILFNTPSRCEDYTEFRRRLLHLASLDFQKRLYIASVVYEEAFPVSLEKGMTPAEVVAAIDRGYRWSVPTDGRPAILIRRVTGRLAITNYDLKRLGNDERKRLNVEIERLPPDHVFVDIRPGSPGGEYPLKGAILLRSFNSIISFVARGISEDAG